MPVAVYLYYHVLKSCVVDTFLGGVGEGWDWGVLHYPCSLNLKQALMGWGFTKVQSQIAFCANTCRIYLFACWVKSFGKNLGGILLDVIMIDIKFLFVLYRLNWGKQSCDIRMHAITIQLILKFEIVKNMISFLFCFAW